MKRRIISLAAAIISAVLLLSMAGCGRSENAAVKGVIHDFQKACNRLDLNAMLDCIDPDEAQQLRMAAGIVGMIAGTDSDKLFDGLSNLLFSGFPGGADLFSSIKIDIQDIKIDGDRAAASVEIACEVGGTKTTEDSTIQCVCKDGKWYIDNLLQD